MIGETPAPPASLQFVAKWQGRELDLSPLGRSDRVSDLKRLLQDETSVPATRQKLMGLVKGKLPSDDTTLGSLVTGGMCKGPPYKFTFIGTPDDQLLKEPEDRDDLIEVRRLTCYSPGKQRVPNPPMLA